MSDRLALVIANSEFDDSKLCQLRSPGYDADVLSQVLSDPTIGGFEVTLLVNETEPVMRRQIARLYHRRKRGDLLLLYYSGHGLTDEHSGRLYLATRDTEMDIASATALDTAFVQGQIDRSNSQRKVVILDCCHSGAFAGAMGALGSSAGTREAFAGNGYGRAILTASNALEFAWEGDKLLGEVPMSVFTHFLIEGLQTGAADLDGDGRISLDELYKYVYEQVITSGSKQTPRKWVYNVEGEIIIARNPRPVVKPVELPSELQQAVESPFAGLREGAVSELERLLQGSDEGLALAAREALARLGKDDSRVEDKKYLSDVTLARLKELTFDELTNDTMVWEKDGKEMVRIAAGKFLYGDEKEERELPEFWIDKTPVTNAEYKRFLDANPGHSIPSIDADWARPYNWDRRSRSFPQDKADHPVVLVSWHDAVAYAEWAGKRLPTEEEWEKAARGTDGREYPWGKWEEGRCSTRETGIGTTTPVAQYSPAGDSPYGCAGMAGNVWEWTSSLWEPGSSRRVERGGSWHSSRLNARCAYRLGSVLLDSLSDLGFRCVSPVS
jgi:formylglycine-generating enzyme required for sulfatase activity